MSRSRAAAVLGTGACDPESVTLPTRAIPLLAVVAPRDAQLTVTGTRLELGLSDRRAGSVLAVKTPRK